MDALRSFQFLADNLPSWITNLDELAVRASVARPDYSQLAHVAGVTPEKPTNASTESLRPIDGAGQEVPTVAVNETKRPLRAILGEPSNKHLFKEARRKRKPRSVISGASGPQKYRTKSMIIVYYDSFIQEAFEALVRNIGSARNNLRKGKMQASMKERMSALGDDDISLSFTDFGSRRRPKEMQTKLTRIRTGPEARVSQATAVFDTVEKDLEAAQSLCEVAAHQFLRDGDCGLEIEGTRQRFEACLDIARKEVDRLEKEKEIEKEEEEAEERVQEEESKTTRMGNGLETIEIDDEDGSDASSFELDITAFRSTRR